MPKNLFKCSGCGHLWGGRPLAERKNVRTDSKNKDVIKCPSCHQWLGYFLSEDVPASLVAKKSIAAAESVEHRIEETVPEKSLNDYIRILGKTKDAESLRQGLSRMVSGGEVKFDDLLKLLMVQRVGGSADPNTAIAELRNDVKDLKRAVENQSTNVPSPTPLETLPRQPSPTDLLIKKIIESLPLSGQESVGDLILKRVVESLPVSTLFSPRDNSSGLRFDNLNDLQQAAKFFQSSSGRNVLDVECEKSEHELRAKKYDSDSRVEFAKIIAKGLKDFGDGMGWNIGSALSTGGPPKFSNRSPSANPIDITGIPTAEDSNILEITCPNCNEKIYFERGRSSILCPKCSRLFQIVPEESRAPDSSRAEVETTELHTQPTIGEPGALSINDNLPAGQTSDSAAKPLASDIGSKKRRRDFLTSVVVGE